jgi:hypothetical protein
MQLDLNSELIRLRIHLERGDLTQRQFDALRTELLSVELPVPTVPDFDIDEFEGMVENEELEISLEEVDEVEN